MKLLVFACVVVDHRRESKVAICLDGRGRIVCSLRHPSQSPQRKINPDGI